MKRLGRKSAFGTPRRVAFLKNACSGVPEALFFSKILVRDSPKRCFYQKCLFGTPRSVVFIKNTCSGVPEALFLSKILVLESPKRCFSQKQPKHTPYLVCFFQKRTFQPLGRAIFFKNGCSNPLDELFFSKTIVPTPWTGLTIKNILQCGYS